MHRWLRGLAIGMLWLLGTLVWAWCLGAVRFHPWWSDTVGLVLAMVFVVGSGIAVVRLPWENARRVLAIACAVVVGFELLPQPSHRGEWSRLQSRMPTAAYDGDRVTIDGLRRTTYDGDTVVRVEHHAESFDLATIDSVWFGVQHFSGWRALAHTFVSFGFEDGRYLAISVESRRHEGQPFSPVAGMYRNYGLIYVLGDECEIIGARAVLGNDPIYLYPIRSTPRAARAMLVDMLDRANGLAERPEFYDTWENNCTNNVVGHLNRIAPIHIRPWSWRIAFPGNTGRVAYDHGLIDSDEPLEAIQRRAFINDRARAVVDPHDFSAAIRRTRGVGGRDD